MYDKQTQELMANDLSFSILAIKKTLAGRFDSDIEDSDVIARFLLERISNTDRLIDSKKLTDISKYIKIILNSFESKAKPDTRCRVFDGNILYCFVNSLLISNELLIAKSKAVSIDLRPLLSMKITEFLEQNFKDECKASHRMITKLYCNN